MKNVLSFLIGFILFLPNGNTQTVIDQSYFDTQQQQYNWDMGGSPYLIHSDIKLYGGSNLDIEPGVEVLFNDHYKFDIEGTINAIGTQDYRIIFTSIDIPWNGIRFINNEDVPLGASKLHFCDISNAEKYGTTCTTVDPESSGGAIFVRNFSDLEIFNCNIFDNHVNGQGGAIGLYNSSSPIIENNNIYGNTAIKRGGGICMMVDCHPSIIDNTINDNHSYNKSGGAIGIGDLGTGLGSSPIIVGNTILKNSSFNSGGGVFVCNSEILYFYDNTFIDNISLTDGGGVGIQKNSVVVLDSNIFLNNSASGNGGAVYIGVSSAPIVTIIWCQFIGNSSLNGGGVYLDASELDVLNCIFEDNTATNKGGGIYLHNPKENEVNLNPFKANTADIGSAIYCYKNSSEEINILNNLIVENHANFIGAIYFEGSNELFTHFNHNTVSDNTSTTSISGVCIDDNSQFPDQFKNNILYGNAVDLVIAFDDPYWGWLFSYPTNLQVAENCISINPNFVNNYHLSFTSICKDVGYSSPIIKRTVKDLDNEDRIQNGITDYGCYEFISSSKRKAFGSSDNEEESIKIYPNPATDFINIISIKEKIKGLSIYTLQGKQVLNRQNILNTAEELKVQIGYLQSGIYIFEIRTSSSRLQQRVVIQ